MERGKGACGGDKEKCGVIITQSLDQKVFRLQFAKCHSLVMRKVFRLALARIHCIQIQTGKSHSLSTSIRAPDFLSTTSTTLPSVVSVPAANTTKQSTPCPTLAQSSGTTKCGHPEIRSQDTLYAKH